MCYNVKLKISRAECKICIMLSSEEKYILNIYPKSLNINII